MMGIGKMDTIPYANVKYIFSFEKILNRMKCFEMFFLEILEMQCMYVITVAYFGSVVSWILEWANSVYYVWAYVVGMGLSLKNLKKNP